MPTRGKYIGRGEGGVKVKRTKEKNESPQKKKAVRIGLLYFSEEQENKGSEPVNGDFIHEQGEWKLPGGEKN